MLRRESGGGHEDSHAPDLGAGELARRGSTGRTMTVDRADARDGGEKTGAVADYAGARALGQNSL